MCFRGALYTVGVTAAICGGVLNAQSDASAERVASGDLSSVGGDSAAARARLVADDYVRQYKEQFPELALLWGTSLERHDGLNDNSLPGVESWQAKEDHWLAQVESIDADQLESRSDRATYAILREVLEASRGARICRTELWPVNQMFGWQVVYAEIARLQPVGTPELREQALRRWRQLPSYLDTEIGNLREGVRRGFTTPRHHVQLTIEQLNGLLDSQPSLASFRSPAERDSSKQFREEWNALVGEELVPAVTRYRDFLRDEYLHSARTSIGLSAHPDGLECYQTFIRWNTSLSLSPEEIHRLGQERSTEILEEAKRVGERLYGTTEIAEIRQRVEADPRNQLTREEILEASRNAVRRAEEALPRLFERVPKARAVVEPTPSFREASSAPAEYSPGPQDGSSPATFYVNLAQTQPVDVDVTAFHEVYPGHHLQIAITQEMGAAHPIRLLAGNGAFIEGWAIYAERVADEAKLYSSDFSRLAYFRGPEGMVVDTGINAFGWTRERAIDHIRAHWIFGSDETVESYVDRMPVLPAQAMTYGVGAGEIRRLREEAQAILGPRFDIRQFHTVVLRDGAVPLWALRNNVERWIAETSGSASSDTTSLD